MKLKGEMYKSRHTNLFNLGKVLQDTENSSLDFHISENCNLYLQKLILALKHHLWVSWHDERTKRIHFIASPLKISSLAWVFLVAKTTLQE